MIFIVAELHKGCIFEFTIKTNNMRFWHLVKNENAEVIESYLVGNSKKRMSLEFTAELNNGTYEVIPTNN